MDPVSSLPESLWRARDQQDCPTPQTALMMFTDLHLVWLGLRKATSPEGLQAGLDDNVFS